MAAFVSCSSLWCATNRNADHWQDLRAACPLKEAAGAFSKPQRVDDDQRECVQIDTSRIFTMKSAEKRCACLEVIYLG